MSHTGKYFFLRHAESLLVIDITNRRSAAGAKVNLWNEKFSSSNEQDNQLWYYHLYTHTIRSKMNDFCLDIKAMAFGRKLHGNLITNPFDTHHTARWRIESDGTISLEEDTDHVVEISTDPVEEGSELHLSWRDQYKAHLQTFMARYIVPPYFFIKSHHSKKVLEVDRGNRYPGSKVIIHDEEDTSELADHQLWYEGPEGYVRSKLNGFALDVAVNHEGEERVVMNPFNEDNLNQRWVIEGEFIVNHYREGQVLDIRASEQSNGTEVCSYRRHGKDNQRFTTEFTEYL